MRQTIHLSRIQKASFYSIWLLVAVSGAYFAINQDWLLHDPSDLSVDSLKVHGISAACMLVLFGSLASTHIQVALRRKRNKWSGYSILTVMLLLSVTGIGLYYSPESIHDKVKWAHIWVGLFTILIVPLHIIIGRLSRKRRRRLVQNQS